MWLSRRDLLLLTRLPKNCNACKTLITNLKFISMKFKFYGVALAALAMAACNNEEMLEANKPAEGSRVVFGLVSDNDGTRAQFLENYTLQWTEKDGDKMSLFNGGTLSGTNLTDAKNAIYAAGSTDEDGRPVFTSENMVYPGLAVMVYPCDTIFQYSGSQLTVSVPQNQSKESNLLIPFISNGITIADYNGIKGDGAGYAKKYDIALKQVGTLFTLKPNWEGENYDAIAELESNGEIITPLGISSIELSTGMPYFTGTGVVNVTNVVPNPAKPVAGTRDAWTNVTEVVPATIYNYSSISTTAVTEDLKSSEFVLLPYNNVNYGGEVNDTYCGDNNAVVTVNTNYGTVVLKDKGDVWYGDVASYKDVNGNIVKRTIAEGMRDLLTLTHHKKAATATNTYFPGEKVGGHVARIIDCDLADIDMSTVHIKSERQLLDMIAVHDAIQAETAVVFTIDGDKDGKFTMSSSTVDKLNKHDKITIKPCDVTAEACATIVITDATEVPAIDFLATGTVDIELAAGNWTWTGGKKTMQNVEQLFVTGTDTRLNIQNGAVVAVEGAAFKEIVNNGIVNILGEAKQQTQFINNAQMFIASGAYYAVDKVTFINQSASLDKQGNIKNSGEFGAINGGKIKNFGYIKQATANSKTFITTNQTNPAYFYTAFGDNNKFGTIELFDVNDNRYSITDNANQGFIKITTTAEAVTKANVGVEANYVVVSGDCTKLNTNEFPGRVLYLEIASNKEVEWTTSTTTLTGLIVNEGCKLYLPKTNKATASKALVNGRIYRGGSLTIGGYVSYLGGDAADASNILTFE